jgi:hypothetical protein
LQEAQEMAAIYPVLYVLENSMREVVRRVMAHAHGADWWDTVMTRGKLTGVHQKAESRRNGEKATRWHQRRGADPLDYVDLNDLGIIILNQQSLFFPDPLGARKEWFEQFMRELEPSRNVVCHMNPLTPHNVTDVQLRAAKWFTMLEEQQHLIPAAVPRKPAARST